MLKVFGRPALLVPHTNTPVSAKRVPGMPIRGFTYLRKHPGERKPALPYDPGLVLEAQACAPPPPPPPPFFGTTAKGQVEHDIEHLPPLEACLRHPPPGGSLRHERVRLEVKRQVRVRDLVSAQLMQVRILDRRGRKAQSELPDPANSTAIVAKLYDPLYSDWENGRLDPFQSSDHAFAAETKAYLHLKQVYGSLVPRYFGSYSVEVPVPGDNTIHTRPVRAILYEYISGSPLDEIEADNYSTSQRKAIMTAVINAYSILTQMDVAPLDFHPRNIILVSANEGEKAEVRLIDFGMAWSGERMERDGYVPKPELEPRVDIVEHWYDKTMRDSMRDFAWLVDWPWNEWLVEEYGKDRL